jgi:hypothetical protein
MPEKTLEKENAELKDALNLLKKENAALKKRLGYPAFSESAVEIATAVNGVPPTLKHGEISIDAVIGDYGEARYVVPRSLAVQIFTHDVGDGWALLGPDASITVQRKCGLFAKDVIIPRKLVSKTSHGNVFFSQED